MNKFLLLAFLFGFFNLKAQITEINSSYEGEGVTYNGKTYFIDRSGQFFKKLNEDGTTAVNIDTTTLFERVYTSPMGMFISGSDWNTREANLWKSDGTNQGTVLVKHFDVENRTITSLVSTNAATYFSWGGSIWKTDGTEAGTVQLFDSTTSTPLQYLSLFTIGNTVFVRELNQHILWKLNEETESLQLIKEDFTPSLFAKFNSYYLINLAEAGSEEEALYKLDASGELTKITNTTDGGASQIQFVGIYSDYDTLSGKLYFPLNGNTELWVTDGTALGTRMLATGVFGSIYASENLIYSFTNDYNINLTNPVTGETTQIENDVQSLEGAVVGDKFYFIGFPEKIYVVEDNELSLLKEYPSTEETTSEYYEHIYYEIENLENINGLLHFTVEETITYIDEETNHTYDVAHFYQYIPVVTNIKNPVNVESLVYPNPTSDIVNVGINSNNIPANISLSDIYGNTWNIEFNKTTNGTVKVNLEELGLKSGVYFLLMNYGDTKETVKVVKK